MLAAMSWSRFFGLKLEYEITASGWSARICSTFGVSQFPMLVAFGILSMMYGTDSVESVTPTILSPAPSAINSSAASPFATISRSGRQGRVTGVPSVWVIVTWYTYRYFRYRLHSGPG